MSMKDKKNDKHIIVVGDSTAGAIVSTYLKKYWKERVDITLISSSKIKSIGVGESTTPTIFRYLNFMGITLEDLVKNTNSTFKLGIKFKNWMNDGNHYYHNFRCPIPFSLEENYEFNFINSQEIIRGESFGASLQDDYFLENNYIPESLLEDENKTYAVHFDTFEFSNYLLKRFGTDLNIIDAKVEEVFVKDDKIEKILLDNKEQLTGDLYIDCSGFSRVLIKNLDGEWVDKKDYLPLDRAIPFSIHKKYDYIEPYTLAEATDQGWIWQIPLNNRYGGGYIYSSQFLSDEEAMINYDKWLKVNHSLSYSENRVIEFIPGYYKKSWVGNCISMGLSSGFVEPLESTSIQTLVQQIDLFSKFVYGSFIPLPFNIHSYNERISQIWEELFKFIRIHYLTRRKDSSFWKHMDDITPLWCSQLEEKVKYEEISVFPFAANWSISHLGYAAVCRGLGMYKYPQNLQRYLDNSGHLECSVEKYEELKELKIKERENFIPHRECLDKMKKRVSFYYT